MIYQIRITLRGTKPPIWRKLAVPSGVTLGQLHELIQIAMGWSDCHLHGFVLKDKSLEKNPRELARLMTMERFEDMFAGASGMRTFSPKTDPFGMDLDMEGEDEDAVALAEVCPRVKSKLTYEYDFGDGWEHLIEVQKIIDPKPGTEYPVCLSGKLACPPEDCGGVWGYYDMLEAIENPEHESHEDLTDWLDEDFDPQAFDLEEINACLAQWRKAPQRDGRHTRSKR